MPAGTPTPASSTSTIGAEPVPGSANRAPLPQRDFRAAAPATFAGVGPGGVRTEVIEGFIKPKWSSLCDIGRIRSTLRDGRVVSAHVGVTGRDVSARRIELYAMGRRAQEVRVGTPVEAVLITACSGRLPSRYRMVARVCGNTRLDRSVAFPGAYFAEGLVRDTLRFTPEEAGECRIELAVDPDLQFDDLFRGDDAFAVTLRVVP